jgi:hypothetical protein
MQLILLLILFAVLGYLLARSRAGKQIDETAGKLTNQAVEFTGKSSDWVDDRLGRKPSAGNFKTWAVTAEYVPADLRDWAASLSDADADAFNKALQNHASSLDMDLNQLFSGSLDSQPDQRKVYVEAVAVYSQAYRKAKEVKKEEAEDPEVVEGEVIDGKAVAEKNSSRRKQNSDTAEEPA